ncbi:MAG: hypothetical protein OEY89_14000 [Gammaproteobacteria bacterium]|nr:hypothetical protein [Gammaproteobacteria bacterium]
MKIVKFANGMFGLRKFSFLSMKYRYLRIGDNSYEFWRSKNDSKFEEHCMVDSYNTVKKRLDIINMTEEVVDQLTPEKIKPVERVFRLVSENKRPERGQFGAVCRDLQQCTNPDVWYKCEVWEEVTNESK